MTPQRRAGEDAAVADAGTLVEPTIGTYFESFSPGPSWDDVCTWPPDVFAVANLVLEQTEAYRFAVAPPAGRRWPPVAGWNELVTAAGREWRAAAGSPEPSVPVSVRHHWELVVRHRHTSLRALREGREVELCESLLTLLAMADEACSGLTSEHPPGPFECRAWQRLDRSGSLSRIHTARIRVTPKTHFTARGMTTRSLTRYLALNYEAIDVTWRRVDPVRWSERNDYNILLLPWPLEVKASAFRPVEGPLENMDAAAFGFFEFDPDSPLDLDLIGSLVRAAGRRGHRVHAVVLPEEAVATADMPALERRLGELGVVFLVTGVRERGLSGDLGRNYVRLGVRTSDGWEHFEQAKHHRWCLDESQVKQYHLGRVLDPSKVWWEAIDLPVRTAEIIDVGRGVTIAPLVCEDLARLDEVADVLRRAGPTLVISLLLDGPQLPQRWSCRYATVLADDPGSTVLTLTPFGMAARSRPAGMRRSRAVAMWSEPGSGLRQIDLGPGASGILITTAVQWKTVWTADGRRHENNTPSVTLTGVQQLRAPRTSMTRPRPAESNG